MRYVQERLAILDGDVDRIVELLGGDLTGPYQYIRVAEAMLELDRPDDALGMGSTRHRLDERLAGRQAVRHRRRGDRGSWRRRRRVRSSSGAAPADAELDHLRQAEGSGRVDRRAGRTSGSAARSVLGARDVGGLVDALLADGDTDAAWTAATDANAETIGDQRWARLAEEREATHPAAALSVYLRLIDSTLEKADRRNYRAAAKQLKRAQKAAAAAGPRPTSSTSTSRHSASSTAAARPSSRSSTRPGCDRRLDVTPPGPRCVRFTHDGHAESQR